MTEKKFLQEYFKKLAGHFNNEEFLENLLAVKKILLETKSNGKKTMIFGNGGSAANASHAVNDFRKIAGIECYAPSDNVSELTARINDDGWNTSYKNWLMVNNLSKKDSIFIFSVGGGDSKKKVSVNLIESIKYAISKKSTVLSIVSRNGGYAFKHSNAGVIIPVVNKKSITPHAEAFQAVIWHLIVTHPKLSPNKNKWESIK